MTEEFETDIETESPPKEDAPEVGMLPPMRFALFIAGGIVLDWLIPLNMGHGWGWLGLLLVIAALTVGKWAINTFKKAGTNVPPNKPAHSIVQGGPFKYSRNPMYLSFVVMYVGLAMLADAPLMLFLSIGLWYVLDNMVIEKEEEYLTAKFGDEYLTYCDKVRRWI